MQDGDNLSDVSNPKVTLESEDFFSDTYNAYFKINKNQFEYTTSDSKPEVMLTIKRPDGTMVESVEDLTYTTSNGVEGFDVTEALGVYMISEDYEIETDGETIGSNEWEFTLYFINLDSNQNDNNGKIFTSNIIMKKDSSNSVEVLTDKGELEKVEGTDYSMIPMSANAILSSESEFTDIYSLYYNVEENGFKDSTEESKVLLKIVKPDGTELTELEGYLRKTVGDITGFDITNEDEQIAIFEDREITTDSLVEETWKFVVYVEDLNNINYNPNIKDNYDVLKTYNFKYLLSGGHSEVVEHHDLKGVLPNYKNYIKDDFLLVVKKIYGVSYSSTFNKLFNAQEFSYNSETGILTVPISRYVISNYWDVNYNYDLYLK